MHIAAETSPHVTMMRHIHAPRADAMQQQIAWHLEQCIADKEHARAERKGRVRKPGVVLQRLLRKADVRAVEKRQHVHHSSRNGSSRRMTLLVIASSEALACGSMSSPSRSSRSRPRGSCVDADACALRAAPRWTLSKSRVRPTGSNTEPVLNAQSSEASQRISDAASSGSRKRFIGIFESI